MIFHVDFHVHSAASHDGYHSVATLCREAKARGLHAIAVCDHDICTQAPAREDILLIPGVEISTLGGHILGLFLQKPVDMDALHEGLEENALPEAYAAIDAIHACGGVAVLAHPYAPNKRPTEELLQYPVDAIEVCNARAALHKGANEQARKLAQAHKLPMSAGSDAHQKQELGGCYTAVEADALTLNALREALLAGRTEAKFVHACRWRYKGFTRVRRDKSWHCTSIRTYLYFCGALLRDLFQK